jgi:2-polyprenyl-3-methyl-5-hydroxy-6-metoxy-1,4-benzoquinol methylase
MRRKWNHNTHYHRVLIQRVPEGASRALDVGCGDGQFARLLASRVHVVVPLDLDSQQVARARRAAGSERVRWQCADLLTLDQVGSFDVITALAVVHHMPFDQAVDHMRRLLADRGRLLLLGVWPARATVTDVIVSGIAVVANSVLQVLFGKTQMESPTRAPAMSLREVRRRAQELLPGVRVRRRLLWRYTLEWTKPAL